MALQEGGDQAEDVFGKLAEAPMEAALREPVFLPQPVTTVARQPSTVGRSPAAVFVVTQEMIRRSGARSIPELLRMVPGLHVARIDANKWSISSRGFASRVARKLLVQIDGRVVYTQLFGGTLWDVQDLLLDDIERIEVIRGPGATMWGANAVNGIINIITKSARDTHGVYAEGGGGTEERSFAGARVGGVTPNCVHWRVSTKWFERDRQFEPNGLAQDDWRQGRVAFRADWEPNCCNAYTVQGDLYTGKSGMVNDQPFFGLTAGDHPVAGGNLLGRWTRTFSEQSDLSLQVYYDRMDVEIFSWDINLNVFDVDFQRRLPLNDRHKLIWGLGYRRYWDDVPNSGTPALLSAVPTARTLELFSAFIQDEIMLREDSLYFTIGTKLSDNTYTDFEVQPTARMLWLPNERSAVWAAVSRAVRIPSRMERDGRMVVGDIGGVWPVTILGSPNLDAEETIAYEIGYRQQPVEWFSWDLAFFYNVDEDLDNSRMVLPFPPTLQAFNCESAEGCGVEISGNVDLTKCWRISAWYSFLDLDVRAPADVGVSTEVVEGANPANQVFLMSSWDLGRDVEFDLLARYVDGLSSNNVPHYTSMDARLAWRPAPGMEFSVVGQNLLDSHHPEFSGSKFVREVPTEVQRGVYGMLSWRR